MNYYKNEKFISKVTLNFLQQQLPSHVTHSPSLRLLSFLQPQGQNSAVHLVCLSTTMARTSQSTPRHNDRQIQILRPLQSHAYISPGSSICWHHRAVQNDLAPDLTTAGLGGWRSQALLVPPKLLDFQRASPWCRLPIAHPKSFKLSIR